MPEEVEEPEVEGPEGRQLELEQVQKQIRHHRQAYPQMENPNLEAKQPEVPEAKS